MPEPRFRFVSIPSALRGAPAGWAREMLREGEVALLADEGLDAINDIAHELEMSSIPVVRTEQTTALQDRTVIGHAEALPLVWVAPRFEESSVTWARDRGPMTLLVNCAGPLPEDERRRIDRFVASLGRQSE